MEDNARLYAAGTNSARDRLKVQAGKLTTALKGSPQGGVGPGGYTHGFNVDRIARGIVGALDDLGYIAPVLQNTYTGFDMSRVLQGPGAAFDLLDTTLMFKDTAGTEPVAGVGDAVQRVNTQDGSSYLLSEGSAHPVLVRQNGVVCLQMRDSRFRVEGFDPTVPTPVVAIGTKAESNSTGVLFWYSNSGTGYGSRKWGALKQSGQFRVFFEGNRIDVLSVADWQPYHSSVMDKAAGSLRQDGQQQGFSTAPETYDATDNGLRVGGYHGSTSEQYRGILTHFVVSGDTLNYPALAELTTYHRTVLTGWSQE